MRRQRAINDLIEQMDEGYRWLARKKDGWLFTFKEQPKRVNNEWNTEICVICECVESQVSDFYSSITPNDTEPTDLSEFLKSNQTEKVMK